jgi:Domain of unknown function (DUF4411)
MLYLLDANTLITANNLYYPLDSVPEFWEWMQHVAAKDLVKMPLEIYEEIKDGPDEEKDPLFAWIQGPEVKDALLLPEVVDPDLVRAAISVGYAADLNDTEIEELGRDPFLVAYAMADPANRVVVTAETSAPRKQRANRKVPDVCITMGVRWCNPFELNRSLGFRTNWKSGKP